MHPLYIADNFQLPGGKPSQPAQDLAPNPQGVFAPPNVTEQGEMDAGDILGGQENSPMPYGLSESIHDSGLDIPGHVDAPKHCQDTPSTLDHSLDNRPSISDVRQILASLIARNAWLRVGGGSAGVETFSNGVQSKLHGLLTDDACGEFAEYMRTVERQKALLNGTNGNGDKIPKAPRAMLESERVRVLEGLLRLKDQNNSQSTVEKPPTGIHTSAPNVQIPIPLSATISPAPTILNDNPIGSTATTPPVSAPTPTPGIAIPLDPRFFSAATTKEREEGEVRSSSITPSPSKKLSLDPVRAKHSLRSDDQDYTRRSASPEHIWHRLPSWRTYRSSRSPEGMKRPRSPPSRRGSRYSPPPPSRHSPPPAYIRRTFSPDRQVNRPPSSPEVGRWHSRRPPSPVSRMSRPFESTSPRPSSQPRRRGSEWDVRPHVTNKNEHYRSRTYPDPDSKYSFPKPRYPQGQDSASNASETSSSDYRRSDHERRRGSTQERDHDIEMPLQIPNRLISPATTDGELQKIERKKTPSPPPSQIIPPGKPSGRSPSPSYLASHTPPPVLLKKRPTEPSVQEPEAPSAVDRPCHIVPGLWMVKAGLGTVEIMTCEFEIDQVVADKWGIRGPSKNGKEKEHQMLSLRLACVPLEEVETKKTADRQDAIVTLSQIETVWPPAGHLVIEVNPDREWGRSWLPRHLGEDQASIDIIDHVHEGINIIRFIQLGALDNHMFLVIARPKPPDFYSLEAASLPDIEGEMEVDGNQTAEQLLKDFVTSIQITYS